jgi:PAS domain S-box-containing protein
VVCDIQLVDQETNTISPVALHHPDKDVEKAIHLHLSNRVLKIGEGMIGSVVQSGKEFYLPKLTDALREIVKQQKLNPIIIPSSFAYVPLSSHDQILGTLDLTRLSHQETLKEQDLVQIRDLAIHASRFIENRLLQSSQKREIELRKKAESKLERNRIMLERLEAETRSMLNSIPIFIARVSKDLKYLFLNDTYRTLGIQPNSMEGKFIHNVIGEEALEKLKPNFDRVLAGEMVRYDYEGTMADGSYRYMNVALAPEFSEDGSVIGFYSCSTDVTSKVEAEKAAKLTQDRMETLSLNSGDAFFFHDADQLIIDVNQVACDMLGYSRDEFLKMRAFEIDPRWKGKSYMKFLDRLEPNSPQTFETTVYRKDGAEVPVEVRFVKRKEGKKTYIQSLVRDRTEKHQQEVKLQQSEERLRLLFDSVEDSISIVDENGAVETINKTFQGVPVSEVIGASIFDYYSDEQIKAFVKRKFKELVEHGTAFELEDAFTGPDGTTFVYSIKYIGIFLGDEFFKAIAIVRDITAERDREHSVMNAVLRGQEQERKRLGAELHDGIGQVLSAIALQVSQIREDVEAVDKEIISKELNTLNDKLQSAIREVRDISHDLMPEVLESFGLNEAVNQVCRNLHDRSGIQVKFDSVDMEDSYDPLVEVNLYRIAQELLNNVQKHAHSKRVFVSLMDHGDTVSLTIEDDGMGFDPEADMNGIGLKNIHSRIKMLGGQIDVESAENSGTLVNIEVPKKKE